MVDRERAVEAALGSVRMEGLEPSQGTLELLAAWTRGEASDEDLRAADDQLLTRRAVAAVGA